MCKLLAFCGDLAFFMGSCWGLCVVKQRGICSDLMLGFHQLASRDTQNLGLQGLCEGLKI